MKGKFLYFELITAAIAIIGVYNCSNNNTPFTILNMVVLLSYSLVCYFVAATRRNVSNTKEVINAYAHQLSWFGMSIMAVGNLFQIQYYPGKGTMMMIGLVTGVATLPYSTIFLISTKITKSRQRFLHRILKKTTHL
ncbi:MAG: hypothetical protein IKR41_00735 [Bacteroidales bacterium]|nr:hypothetical protein [Bacteroidales bacterium]